VRTLYLSRDFEQELKSAKPDFADQSHVDQFIDVDTTVITPERRVIAVVLCSAIPAEFHMVAFDLWQSQVNDLLTNRPKAVGTEQLPTETNRRGVVGKRLGVNELVLADEPGRQAILGYKRRPGAATKLTLQHPEVLEGNQALIELIASLYKENLPTFYARQRAEIKRTPNCRLWQTPFSTIYLAKNFRTAYHRDAGNLAGAMTALTPTGKFVGAELVLPRWGIAFRLRPGDLLFFDPQQLHGNLPIRGERISAALYCAQRM
jgi:hypothetical protein